MEDQFREAAENYHLPTERAFDWEKVSSALSEERNEPEKEQGGKKKRHFVFWYLLFIPMGWFAHYIVNYQAKNNSVDNNILKQPVVVSPAQDEKPGSKKETGIKNSFNSPLASSHQNTAAKSHENAPFSITLKRASKKNTTYTVPVLPYAVNENATGFLKPGNNTYDKTIADNATGSIISQPVDGTVNLEVNKSTPSNNQGADAAITKQPGAAVSSNQNTSAKNQAHGFYAGLLFAPDISFIKFQRASGIGSSYGLVAGYALNKNWAIETGILSDKKNYYTSGKYFDKSHIAYFNDKELLSVEGKCRMIEIPLNVRYTFNTTNRSAFSAALGTSSYFMNEEYYNYSFVANGQNGQSDREYNAPSKKFFAVINLGAGYERNIGKNLSLRFEPYAKIPVRGIGTGNLSISSTGINVGIIKSIPK